MGRPKATGFSLQKKGTNFYVVHRYTTNGKQTSVSTGKSDKQDATEWAINYLKNLRSNQIISTVEPGTEILPKELYDILDETKYLENILVNSVSKEMNNYFIHCDKQYSPRDSYNRKNLIKSLIKWCNDNNKSLHTWKDFSKKYIDGYFDSCNLSPVSIWTHALRLSAMFKWMKENGIIKDIPFNLNKDYKPTLKIINATVNEVKPLNEKESKAIYNAMATDRDKLMYQILISTGARIGEITNLLWSNVCLDGVHNYISIVANNENKELGIQYSTLKTARSKRRIPISNNLYTVLMNAKQHSTTPYVIPNVPVRLYYNWSKKSKIHSICKDFHAHILRHTFITRALSKGISVHVVSKWVGDSPRTIEMVYNHYIQSDEINDFQISLD